MSSTSERNRCKHIPLRIGVLGCGPIAQFAHFDAVRKANNAELYAICDVAEDLLRRMVAIHSPQVNYTNFDVMLADPAVDAVLIAVADQYHIPLCRQALRAGKHVLIEKPLGVTVEECLDLQQEAAATDLVVQVGNNRRFDPGVAFARDFVRNELGDILSLSAWYFDSVHRYTVTDNLQPALENSSQAMRPPGDPKADRRRYLMLAHGSHLVDTARILGGEIASVQARLVEKFGAYCWSVQVVFESGASGHLELTVAVRDDFEEGFRIHGENGSVTGRLFHPWYYRSGEVVCFSTVDNVYRRPFGQDAHSYKLQVEGFVNAINGNTVQQGASISDGIAAMRLMVAIARSVESGRAISPAAVTGGV